MSGRRPDPRRALGILVGSIQPRTARERAAYTATREAAQAWLYHPGVQGLGIGHKVTMGRRRRTLALLVYVERKLPPSLLESVVPKTIKVPGVRNPVPTDVVPIGKLRLQRADPLSSKLLPGIGISRSGAGGGTFGCLVRRAANPSALYILSNYHVLAGGGCAEGDAILHPPSLGIGDEPPRSIGELAAWETPLPSATDYPNTIDAAIALVTDPTGVGSYIPLVGVPIGASNDVFRGLTVQKTGYSTGHTISEVVDVDAHLFVSETLPDGTVARTGFGEQVRCKGFTSDGDSGAVVLNLRGEVLGLHFVGSDQASFFNRIGYVTKKLGIEIVTEEI